MEMYKSLRDQMVDIRMQFRSPLSRLAEFLAIPISAYASSYIGEGIGYVFGNIIDYLPYLKDATPWLAERTGLIDDLNVRDFNENFYQTFGVIAGIGFGLLFTPGIIKAWRRRKYEREYDECDI